MMFIEPGPGGSRTVQAHSPELPRVWETLKSSMKAEYNSLEFYSSTGEGKKQIRGKDLL